MKYDSTWESIDSRPVPAWFADAKFGIFIHWGIYSVPAFANKKGLAEWYYHALVNECEHHEEFVQHHERVYGKNKRYEDFVSDFTAENFDAKEWIELFTRAGARYMNLVSKHHDGFCMYKSDYAWNWNSVDVGPKRDFCRELKDACDGTPVRFGVYHSLYEWFNPLYLKDPDRYSREHLVPMLKELIEKYEPSTLFTDGEWEYEDDVWHSREFLQWLYNESPVKDYIVPNDRWGRNTRGVHGGNFTTEYGLVGTNNEVITDLNKTREECRGIGGSFGWNKYETVEDYLTEGELIRMFVDLVSQGSNLLLNVGPTPDGRIPVIMQERLLQMGQWLDVNGEGIYGTRKYVEKADGDVRYTKKGDTIFAFILKFPFGEITLEDVEYAESVSVKMLGYDSEIKTENDGGHLKLVFGAINPESIRSKYAYCIKIEK